MSAQYHQVDQQSLRDSTNDYIAERHPNMTEIHDRNGNGRNEKPTEQKPFDPPLRTRTSLDIERVDTTEDDKVRFFQTYFGYSMLTHFRSRHDQCDINTFFGGHEPFNTLTNRKS